MAEPQTMGQNNKNSRGVLGGVRARDVAGYLLLPRLLPRISDLFFSGFTLFAFFMAQVYRGVRLLPESHPYLNPSNIGSYGVRDVVGAAASHLVLRRENIDQIIIFFAILIGLVLIAIQAIIFIIALASPEATAQGVGTLFGTPQYTNLPGGGSTFGTSQDLAFIMMDRVFGVEGIFNSCISTNTPCFGVNPENLTFDTDNPVYKPDSFPWPYHMGLHSMFAFYSTALLLVGMLIIIYYAVVIVVETAQTGTPFGKRFNTVWAPIRLVIAIGLLIPIGTGLNAAQYITLYVAKYGSNFATNGWLQFNQAVQGKAEAMANGQGLVVEPQPPEVNTMLKFMISAHACKAMEEVLLTEEYTPPPARPATTGGATTGGTTTGGTGGANGGTAGANNTTTTSNGCDPSNNNIDYETMNRYKHIDAYVVTNSYDFQSAFKPLNDLTYEDARRNSQNNDIVIRFGDQSCRNVMHSGLIAPLCGEVVLPAASLGDAGSAEVQKGYFDVIKYMWGGYGATDTGSNRANGSGGRLAETFTNTATQGRTDRYKNLCNIDFVKAMIDKGASAKDKFLRARGFLVAYRAISQSCPDEGQARTTREQKFTELENEYSQDLYSKMGDAYRIGAGDGPNGPTITRNNTGLSTSPAAVLSGYRSSKGSKEFLDKPNLIALNIIRAGADKLRQEIHDGKKYNISAEALSRGWAAAGIWYNKIAQMNGALVGAAWNYPMPARMPRIIEQGVNNQALRDQATNNRNSRTSGDQVMQARTGDDLVFYNAILQEMPEIRNAEAARNPPSGNVLSDLINNLFGLEGLFNMRSPVNQAAHPLAQLVGVGKSLIEASIRNMGAGLGIGGLGVITSFLSGAATGGALDGISGIMSAVSGLMFSVATITLTAGFILYYVVPFLPFLYFFFAVGNWLKGVFEAMVGVPLWALAHLRIDGNGLPGEAAINGYFMLFEIFLRPILIVFGLLASVTIFAAMGAVLNDVYDTVVVNLTGASTGAANRTTAVDRLFYTIMYAVIMYMMALSSFKLIDLIPNQIMRWMGTSVSTFSDMSGDPAQTLTQYTAIAGSQIVSQVTGGAQNFIQGVGKAGGDGGRAINAMINQNRS